MESVRPAAGVCHPFISISTPFIITMAAWCNGFKSSRNVKCDLYLGSGEMGFYYQSIGLFHRLDTEQEYK